MNIRGKYRGFHVAAQVMSRKSINKIRFTCRKSIFPSSCHKKAQSVTCLTTDARVTADPGVTSSIPAWSHTFVEIDHEFISMIISSLPLIYSRRVVASYK